MGGADGGIRKFRVLVDQNPEWESDLWSLYQFNIWDVFKDRAPLSLAFGLIERLTYEPWSLWRANKLGGPEHLGWSPDTYMIANNVDATMMGNALAANSGSKRKAKMPEPVSRPETIKEAKPVAKSIMNIDVRSLEAMMGH